MEREKNTFMRRAESSLARNGGKVGMVLGLIRPELFVAGLLAYLIGKEIEPKK